MYIMGLIDEADETTNSHEELNNYESRKSLYPFWWPSLTTSLQSEPKKGRFALVWLDRRRMPALYERTNSR